MKEDIIGAIERLSKAQYDIGYATLYSQEEQDEDIKILIKGYKQLEEENEIYKEELKKIDKALNLEEGTAAPYRNEIIESFKKGIESLKEIIDNSVTKSKIKEIIEWWKKEGYVYGTEKLLSELQKLI